MTISTTNTPVDHTTDAAFRVWAAEVIAQFLAVGLTQTADTGQINTTTVTRPSSNTAGGYAIFRFNDTLQATQPIFLKLELGTGGAATTPGLWLTVGTGSNGSGTINGTVGTRTNLGASGAAPSTVTNYLSRFCYLTSLGVFWFAWKMTSSSSLAGAIVGRSSNTSGVPTGESIAVLVNGTSATYAGGAVACTLQNISFLTSTVVPATPNAGWTMWPGGVTTAAYAGNIQTAPIFGASPNFFVAAWAAISMLVDFPVNATFTVALVGSTTYTFISAGGMLASVGSGTGATATGFPTNATFLLPWQ